MKKDRLSISLLPEGDEKYRFNSTKLPWHMDRVRARFGDLNYDFNSFNGGNIEKNKTYSGGDKVVPIHMDVGITKVCNVKCVFCLGFYQNMTGEVMPYDVTVNLLRDAGRAGVRSLAVIGDGEPTINQALYEAVTVGKKEGLDIGLATNAVLLSRNGIPDEKKIETLVDNCTWIRFNVCAVSREGYKTVHQKDFWPRVDANMRKALEINERNGRKCTLGLQMVTTPLSENEIIPEARYAVDNGFDYFEIKQMTQVDDPQMIQFPLTWYKDSKVMDLLKQAQSLSNERTNIMPKWTMMQSEGKRNYNHCLDVSLLMQVSGNSKCYPCAYLFNNEEYCYGDLKEKSFPEIISSPRYWDIINKLETTFDVHKDCQGCCRHDRNNEFLYNYVYEPDKFMDFWKSNVENKPVPNHLNFI